MKQIVETVKRPCYAAVFPWSRNDNGEMDGHVRTAQEMLALATRQPGFLGLETTRGKRGPNMVISYWKDLAAIDAWRAKGDDTVAHRKGRDAWYGFSNLRVARVRRLALGTRSRQAVRKISAVGWSKIAALLLLWHVS
jgi:heme-degrading monooxygenase HmoA